jgi:hypothetical protein
MGPREAKITDLQRKRGKTEDLAERTGLEPATPGVTGRYSNRLNYRSFLLLKPLLVGADGIEPPTFAV